MEDEQVGTGQAADLSQPTAIHHEPQLEGEAQSSDSSGSFEKQLESLINKFSLESESSTPDFILASYLRSCLDNWNTNINERDKWLGGKPGTP